MITGCWIVLLALNLLRQPKCSLSYWGQQATVFLVCLIFTYYGSQKVRDQVEQMSERSEQSELSEEELKWDSQSIYLYPFFAFLAGFFGGFLGIGGGMIMSPLLLELGMIPEVNQATTAMFVLLSSSLATVQFVILNAEMPQYVAWFATFATISTFAGQTAIDYVLRKYKRTSLIILSIAGIIGMSLLLMGATGVRDVVADFQNGADMGFAPHRLCKAV